MNLRPNRKQNVELDITPLIDVVFLLLIFFMVSTTFERESELNITLPEASKELTQAKPDAITIAIDAQSHVYVNDIELVNSQMTTIKQAIYDALGDLEDAPVIISADADTPTRWSSRSWMQPGSLILSGLHSQHVILKIMTSNLLPAA